MRDRLEAISDVLGRAAADERKLASIRRLVDEALGIGAFAVCKHRNQVCGTHRGDAIQCVDCGEIVGEVQEDHDAQR